MRILGAKRTEINLKEFGNVQIFFPIIWSHYIIEAKVNRFFSLLSVYERNSSAYYIFVLFLLETEKECQRSIVMADQSTFLLKREEKIVFHFRFFFLSL